MAYITSQMLRESANGNELDSLKISIMQHIADQGFTIDGKNNLTYNCSNKNQVRKLHSEAVNYLIEKNSRLLNRVEDDFVRRYIANGEEVDIERIEPRLMEVTSEDDAEIFRWVKLHWSIPTSAGYGRRLRYIVWDRSNHKMIGIIGLADPIFAMKDRDNAIGWNKRQRSVRLRSVMDAFVLGSVPPYSLILGGKLVAGLVASTEIQDSFSRKYNGSISLINRREFDGQLAAITTTSALGKSSMYDRLKMYNGTANDDGPRFNHAGWTSGSGEFPFLNGTYQELLRLVENSSADHLGKNIAWGKGVRNRRTVVKYGLRKLGLSDNLLYHGVKREIFITNLGTNWKEFLCGTQDSLIKYDYSSRDISDFIMSRWIRPRAERNQEYLRFEKDEYRINK